MSPDPISVSRCARAPRTALSVSSSGRLPRRHQVAGEIGEQVPGEVTGQAELAVDRQRVGARVGHPPAGVDPQEAVADPRRVGVVAALAGRREVAGRDHLGQVTGGLQVADLEPARRPDAEQVGVARDRPRSAGHRGEPGSPRPAPAPRRATRGRPRERSGPARKRHRPGVGARWRRRSRRCRRRTPSGRSSGASDRPPSSRRPRRSGSHITRSAKDRSAMICQSARIRCSHAMSSSSRSVWRRAMAARDGTGTR